MARWLAAVFTVALVAILDAPARADPAGCEAGAYQGPSGDFVLRHDGRPLEIVVFPDTDHGIQEFVEDPDGTRTMIRVADGYFRLTADWIKQEQHPPYGRATYPAP